VIGKKTILYVAADKSNFLICNATCGMAYIVISLVEIIASITGPYCHLRIEYFILSIFELLFVFVTEVLFIYIYIYISKPL